MADPSSFFLCPEVSGDVQTNHPEPVRLEDARTKKGTSKVKQVKKKRKKTRRPTEDVVQCAVKEGLEQSQNSNAALETASKHKAVVQGTEGTSDSRKTVKRKSLTTQDEATLGDSSAKKVRHTASDGERAEGEVVAAKRSNPAALTLFVGQLAYKVDAAMLKSHFEKFPGLKGKVQVRLLTHKDTGKSRGMGWVQMACPADVHTALRLHRSVLCGRQINVERTVGGGGNSGDRKGKIKDLRERQGGVVQRAQDVGTSEVADAEAVHGDLRGRAGRARGRGRGAVLETGQSESQPGPVVRGGRGRGRL